MRAPNHRWRRVAAAAAIGVLAGLMSGLFGIGGGILIVPGLLTALRVSERLAHGTSLAAILPITAAGAAAYAGADAVDLPAALLLSAGAAAGAFLGAAALRRIPLRALRLCYLALLLLTAARLAWEDPEAVGRVDLTVLTAAGLVVAGVAAGVIAGLLGVGGGLIIVPLLIVGFGVPALVAKGTSLVMMIPAAIVGTWRNSGHGNADLALAAEVGLPGALASVGGVAISKSIEPRLSVQLFAVLLVIVAVRLAYRELRSPRPPEPTDSHVTAG